MFEISRGIYVKGRIKSHLLKTQWHRLIFHTFTQVSQFTASVSILDKAYQNNNASLSTSEAMSFILSGVYEDTQWTASFLRRCRVSQDHTKCHCPRRWHPVRRTPSVRPLAVKRLPLVCAVFSWNVIAGLGDHSKASKFPSNAYLQKLYWMSRGAHLCL